MAGQSFHRSRLFRSLLKASFVFISLICIFYALDYAHSQNFFDFSFADRFLKNNGLYGVLFFWVFAASFSAIGTPRQLLASIAGYSFGFFWGLILATLSVACGAALTFFYARFIARDSLRKKMGKRLKSFERIFLHRPFATIITIRFLPFGNNALTNLMAGLSAIDPRPFFCGTLIGYLPQNMIFAMVGGGIALKAEEMLFFSFLLFLASGALGIWTYKQIIKQDQDGVLLDGEIK